MIAGVHHTSISTKDIARLSRFYCDVLGFREVADGAWSRGTASIDALVGLKDSAAQYKMLNAGNCYIELFQYEAPEGLPNPPDRPACDAGLTHLCLNVTDIDAEYERLLAAGMRFHCPPLPDGGAGMRATYGRDPDGNIIELLEIFKPAHPFAVSGLTLPASPAAA